MSLARTALRRAGAVTALAAAGVLAAAGAASAHVTVHPENYAKGATDGVLTFRVPNEEDTARTTKVQVFLPTDHPVLGVLVSPPRDGWTAKVTSTKLKTPVKTDDGTITDAVSEITWTGGKIGPGQYEDFDVAFGQLPDTDDQLVFKTLQTYSDGKTVRWIEAPQPGGDEPENPAPVLKLTAKTAGDAGGESGTGAAGSGASEPASKAPAGSASASSDGSDSTARGLGIAGLVVGVLGLAAAAFALLRGRSGKAS
ncbi:YcnI family protein [Streptomyces spinosirectus]